MGGYYCHADNGPNLMEKIIHTTDNTALFSQSPVLFNRKHSWLRSLEMQRAPYMGRESEACRRYAAGAGCMLFILALTLLYGYGHKLLNQYGY
jgi:hypothetical protein